MSKFKDLNWVGLFVYFIYPIATIGFIVMLFVEGCDNRFFGKEKADDVDAVTVRVDTVRDTVTIALPIETEREVVRYIKVKPVTLHDTVYMERELDSLYAQGDSMLIPIEQKHYVDSVYEAWVSGFQPSLDSIRIFRQSLNVTNTISLTSRKRWSYGIQGGLYLTPCGVQPGIGFGVTYAFPP